MTITSNNEEYSISKIVNIPALTASFNVIGGGCNASCDIVLENTSTNVPDNYTYHWNYGIDNTYTNNNSNNHNSPEYLEPGVYTINLQIKNTENEMIAQTYRSVTISGGSINLYEDLLFYYPFTNSLDNIVGSNSGVSSPDTMFYFDRDGNALSTYKFDGERYINSNSNLPTTEEITISFWIKQQNNNYTGTGIIISNDELLVKYNNNNLIVNNTNFSISSTNSWINFVLTFDSNGTIKVFENGILKDNTANNFSQFTDENNFVIFGKEYNSDENKFEGLIDDIRIYGRVINQLEINSLYNE